MLSAASFVFYCGVAALLWVVLRVFNFLNVSYFRGSTDFRIYGSGKKYWAVVTGASDGIGKSFAFALAKKGFNILLVARSAEKLQAVASQVEAAHRVQTRISVIDLSKATDADWNRFSESLTGLEIGILVNNAGVSNDFPDYFLAVPLARTRDIVSVNISAVNEVTFRVLPSLLKNKAAGLRGLVLNVGSLVAKFPTPLLAVYSASKSYVACFSAALAAEYKSQGIDVDCTQPGMVISNMSKIRRPRWDCPTSDAYVTVALSQVGHSDTVAVTPYWSHNLMSLIGDLIPLPTTSMIGMSMKMMAGIRKKSLQKLGEGNKQ